MLKFNRVNQEERIANESVKSFSFLNGDTCYLIQCAGSWHIALFRPTPPGKGRRGKPVMVPCEGSHADAVRAFKLFCKQGYIRYV